MRLFRIETASSGVNDPWRAHAAVPESGDADRLWLADANLLETVTGTEAGPRSPEPGEVFLCRSGWFGEAWFGEGLFGEGEPGPDEFESLGDPRLWTGEGYQRLSEAVASVGVGVGAGAGTLWLRTGIGTVLSDPHVATRFGEEHPEVGIVGDPLAMLAPEMESEAAEHFERMLWKLGRLATCRGVVVDWSGAGGRSEDLLAELGGAIRAHASPDWAVVTSADAAGSARFREALGT